MKTPEKHSLEDTYSLTAYFRTIVNNSSYWQDLLKYLLEIFNLQTADLQGRWDSIENLFWEEDGKLISALSFSTIIEARWMLLDSILTQESPQNTMFIEVASGFSPRGLEFVNSGNALEGQYLESDRPEVIEMKKAAVENIDSKVKPNFLDVNVISWSYSALINKVIEAKENNSNIDKVIIFSEWLLIYLKPEEQKQFFDSMRGLSSILKKNCIKLEYATIDMPTHENFTDWLLHEWFTHERHTQIMAKVDPIILECLHSTEEAFLNHVWINSSDIEKFYYSEEIIWDLKTWDLQKYKNIQDLKTKIRTFLMQQIMFAYKVKL